jgi:hypothetical protein
VNLCIQAKQVIEVQQAGKPSVVPSPGDLVTVKVGMSRVCNAGAALHADITTGTLSHSAVNDILGVRPCDN